MELRQTDDRNFVPVEESLEVHRHRFQHGEHGADTAEEAATEEQLLQELYGMHYRSVSPYAKDAHEDHHELPSLMTAGVVEGQPGIDEELGRELDATYFVEREEDRIAEEVHNAIQLALTELSDKVGLPVKISDNLESALVAGKFRVNFADGSRRIRGRADVIVTLHDGETGHADDLKIRVFRQDSAKEGELPTFVIDRHMNTVHRRMAVTSYPNDPHLYTAPINASDEFMEKQRARITRQVDVDCTNPNTSSVPLKRMALTAVVDKLNQITE